MKIKRYYRKQPIEAGRIRAIRDVLKGSHKWEISHNEFILYYPAEDFTITDIEELETAAKYRDKKPTCISAFFCGFRKF